MRVSGPSWHAPLNIGHDVAGWQTSRVHGQPTRPVEPIARRRVFLVRRAEGRKMPTTKLPPEKEKAAEISRKITNTRPREKRDKGAPEGQVTGGFNQKRDEGVAD